MTQKPWFDFDIRNDPVFEQVIKPFIENQMTEMAAYDRQRLAKNPDIKYIFHEHAERVADDVRKTAAVLGQPEHVQEAMYWAMLAHDIGKKTLPIDIWDSEEKPAGDVKSFRRSHTERGLKIAEDILGDQNHPFVDLLKDIIANHHEHLDGSGHHGLNADQISTPVRLCAIVESYDGYTIPRPHFGNRDISPAAVLEKMRTEPDKGAKMFDMELFEAFAKMKLASPPAALKPSTKTTPEIKG